MTADKPESQEICFIPDDDYRGFLRRRIPAAFRPGPIVDGRGAVLGHHSGLANFTVGQRRGLALVTPRPLYVTALDPERNAVVVGAPAELEVPGLVASQVNLISVDRLVEPLAIEAKIRHSHVPVPAVLKPIDGAATEACGAAGHRARVRFDVPQRAVTPGQSVVFYRGDLVVGGGVIEAPTR